MEAFLAMVLWLSCVCFMMTPPLPSLKPLLCPRYCILTFFFPSTFGAASTPGIELPKKLPLLCYQSRRAMPSSKAPGKHPSGQELLLHSTAHKTIEYTAREDDRIGSRPLVNHYVGVYDPRSGKLDIIEARKMVVRGQVRAHQAPAPIISERVKTAAQVRRPSGVNSALLLLIWHQTFYERRTDLGQTFGTKKAKKAIRGSELNALGSRSGQGDDQGEPAKLDDASRATLTLVGQATSTMATKEELQAAIDAAKPVPRANPDAQEVDQVYRPEDLIGEEILNLVPIREWQEKVQHKEGIQTPSRFVAARVNAIANDDEAVTRLRVLRYLAFVLVFYLCTRPGKQRGTRQLPPREKLRQLLSPAPEAVLENIRRKFSDAGIMRKFHIDLLMAHCCAMACIVDNFEVETQNLRDDLKLDQKSINQYFHEIGARVRSAVVKVDGRSVDVAKLALPLHFPKQRQPASRRR